MLSNLTKVKINCCRICLDTKYTDGASFDDGGGLLKMYEYCFGITVSPQCVPRHLCGYCVKKMEDFSKFKLQSHKSENLWKSIITTKVTCHAEKYPECNDEVNIKEDNSDFDHNDSTDNYNCNLNTPVGLPPDIIINGQTEVKTEPINEQDIEDNKNIEFDLETVKRLKQHKKPYECRQCNSEYKFEKHYKKHNCSIKKPLQPIEICCGLCDVKSTNAEEIKEHLNEHNTNNDLTCKLCEFKGRDFADMVTHRYTHQPKKQSILSCHSCGKRSISILSLQFHYRSVHLKKVGGVCTVCSKEFRSYYSWRNHEKWHKTEGLICDLCGRRFLFKNQIISHLREHASYKGYVCDICGKTFKRSSNLQLHKIHVHDNNAVTCMHCNKTFKNQKNLEGHMKRENKGKRFQCKVCLKRYVCKRTLRLHMVWHTDVRPFVCHLCGTTYKVKSQLKVHLRKHTGDMPYKCHLCTRVFPASNQLKVHLNAHSGNRRYKCPYCEKSFHDKKNVVNHCSKRHELHITHVHDNNPVTCTHCNKTFKNQRNLTDHMIRENKEKRFQCEVCSKRYSCKKTLSLHMIWHTDARPFVCHLCGSTYKVKSQLRIHLRKHTGDMPYKCHLCTRVFPSSNQLKVHLNVHSGNRRYKCPYCEKTFHNKKNVVDHCSKRHNVTDIVIEGKKSASKNGAVVSHGV